MIFLFQLNSTVGPQIPCWSIFRFLPRLYCTSAWMLRVCLSITWRIDPRDKLSLRRGAASKAAWSWKLKTRDRQEELKSVCQAKSSHRCWFGQSEEICLYAMRMYEVILCSLLRSVWCCRSCLALLPWKWSLIWPLWMMSSIHRNFTKYTSISIKMLGKQPSGHSGPDIIFVTVFLVRPFVRCLQHLKRLENEVHFLILLYSSSQHPLCWFKRIHAVIHEHVCSRVSALTQWALRTFWSVGRGMRTDLNIKAV